MSWWPLFVGFEVEIQTIEENDNSSIWNSSITIILNLNGKSFNIILSLNSK